MWKRNLIYGLIDPRTDMIRYIGKSTRGVCRPVAHATASALGDSRTHRCNWIRELQRLGLNYRIAILEDNIGSKDELGDLERKWIAYGRSVGWDLTNATDGGDGGGGVQGKATRAKRSDSLRRVWKDPEYRERHRISMLGHSVSDETRSKLSAARRGFVPSDATRALWSLQRRGRKHTAATRAKMSESHKQRLLRQEYVQ